LAQEIINKRLLNFLSKKDIIAKSQSGFCKNRTTFNRILSLISKIRWANLKNQKLHVMYLDIKKAYDSVEHWALIDVLSKMGFNRTFTKLISSIYTNNKMQIITPYGLTSSEEDDKITRGVRQGCPLSPTLFILFINPLIAMLEESVDGLYIDGESYTVDAFADDLTICTTSHQAMVSNFNKLVEFMNTYKLELSIDAQHKNKTVYTAMQRSIDIKSLLPKMLKNTKNCIFFV
jgi:reverse transcriptase-like protein